MNNKIKGYKASYKGICIGHKYEVGQTYTIDKIKMCERGFHFCVEMDDVIRYYPYNKDFVLFDVIGNGAIDIHEDKTVCSQIEIVRIVPKEEYTFSLPLIEYDENENAIHFKDSTGFESWKTFDENNNWIHCKTSTGFESWQTYNEKYNLIHYKDSDGFEVWKTFDENDNLIHFKNSTGYERSYYPLTTN